MEYDKILGVDIGASGIKGAIVNLKNGELLSERRRLVTPRPANPENMAITFAELTKSFDWQGPVGCGFPAIVKDGVALSAANIDKKWINIDIEGILSKKSGCKVKVCNDADAAGVAEIAFGVGKGQKGVVVLITIGSGLGTALFTDGHLVPNTEFGHVFLNNMIAEHYASNTTREKYDLNWKKWGKRFNEYLLHIERLLTPNMIILGGGISKKYALYEKYIKVTCPVSPAKLLNNAGIVGAAAYAQSQLLNEPSNL
jgi:polyphosphate glucokinase